VLGVHAAVPVRDITESQLCDIVAGRVTNWSSLGAGDLAISAHVRPASEVDSEVLRDGVACMKGLAPGPAVHLAENTGDMERAISTTEGAVGVTTSAVVSRSGGKVRALSLDGVAPTASNVARGTYRLRRPSYFVTSARPSPAVSRFLAFVRGPRGAETIESTGSVPAR
jgi:phosphate transport system substrate-binding protein